jgi:L-Ala-D/L-Glu epimerase
VKIRSLTWRAYRIPFRRTFVTSAAAQAVRTGMIVRLEGEDGLYGLGEIAPLRKRTEHDVASLLGFLKPRLSGIELDEIPKAVKRLYVSKDVAAAIRCGLDIAACDLMAKAAGVPVAEFLGGRLRTRVPVNATISAPTPELAAQAARRAVENGFRCVKLKVGMMRTIAAECELVGAVRGAIGPGVSLRVDANEAWTPAQAISTIRALERFDLEFVEQPVPAYDLQGLKVVREAIDTLIAADEPIISERRSRAFIEGGAVDLVVIKPMVVGGMREALKIARSARSGEVESIITTTIDSGVGIAAALHLAAAIEDTRACGLATAELLECDLMSGTPQPVAGMMVCPDAPGLGVEIDEVKSAPYLDRL